MIFKTQKLQLPMLLLSTDQALLPGALCSEVLFVVRLGNSSKPRFCSSALKSSGSRTLGQP